MKEDFQKSQQGTGGAENKGESRSQQNNQTTGLSFNQKNKIAHQAGLGRDRIADIEDSGRLSGRDDYAGGDNDEMRSQKQAQKTADNYFQSHITTFHSSILSQ